MPQHNTYKHIIGELTYTFFFILPPQNTDMGFAMVFFNLVDLLLWSTRTLYTRPDFDSYLLRWFLLSIKNFIPSIFPLENTLRQFQTFNRKLTTKWLWKTIISKLSRGNQSLPLILILTKFQNRNFGKD